MGQLVRQSNLFAAEDWKVIYRSFQDADFQSYDFDTIRQSMLNYVARNYPEEFNDYINSSEFIAIIDLLAYLGQSLSFRIDLNARENFVDTASRRESILRLANMLSYKPARNSTARGLVKLTAIKTSEPVTDSAGNNLSNVEVRWNDPNNPNWFEQFIVVLNTSISETNQFGKPTQSQTINSLNNDMYGFNNIKNVQVSYPFSSKINNENYTFEIVPAQFNTAGYIEEASPNPLNSFNVIYKNDGKGYGSVNTGFFLYMKEGSIAYQDFNFDQPVENRTVDVNVEDINNTDVWVQEISSTGLVETNWKKVPALSGQNIIYNSLALSERNTFEVNTRLNDQISIQFADGDFGNIPVGLYRIWYRSSALKGEAVQSSDIQNKGISFGYINKQNQTFDLSMTFSLNYTITNSASRESVNDIKLNSAQAYYTQDRMITAEDYNVFPVTKIDGIQKIKALNKTHAGHSRFIDIQDPTGTVANVNCVGEDGIAYKSPNTTETIVTVLDNSSYEKIVDEIEKMIQYQQMQNFYFDTYKKDVEANLSTGSETFKFESTGINSAYWRTLPTASSSYYGYFTTENTGTNRLVATGASTTRHGYIRKGSKIEFVDSYSNPTKIIWATVKSVTANGDPNGLTTGPIELTESIPAGYIARAVVPHIRTEFTATERASLLSQLTSSTTTLTTFGIGYNYYNSTTKAEEWYIIANANLDTASEFSSSNNTLGGGAQGVSNDSSWLVRSQFTEKGTNTNAKFTLTARGLDYVFQSTDDVRFFYVKDYKTLDTETGLSVQDRIDILADVNTSIEKGIGATATATINAGAISEYVITASGSNYTTAPIVTVTGDGTGAQAVATVHNGSVIAVTATQVGSGYTTATVTLTSPEIGGRLPSAIQLAVVDNFTEQDGYIDNKKVKIAPYDADEDGMPDYPLAMDDLIYDTVNSKNYIFFESYVEFDGYTYYKLSTAVTPVTVLTNSGIEFLTTTKKFYNNGTLVATTGQQGEYTATIDSKIYRSNTGRSYKTTSGLSDPLFFQWKHTAPRDQRIDPSISNIVELIVLTSDYYNDVLEWSANNRTVDVFPSEPSVETLNNLFSSTLKPYKAISDQIIYTPAKFKRLFGSTADSTLQGTFKIIKSQGATITDNEIKSRVLSSITTFFSITNWSYGESFYYTELCAFIHSQLSTQISSVVIVGKDAESVFGDLFEITSQPNELFYSTATVDDIEIINSFTDQNLKKGS
jgi:hypothetical protein